MVSKSNQPETLTETDGWFGAGSLACNTLPELLDTAVSRYGDRNAYDFMGKKATYRELGKMIDRAAAGLQGMGVGPGCRVGLYMPNTPYFPIMFFAALKVGAVAVPYDLSLAEEEIGRQASGSGTDILVTLNLRAYLDKALRQIDKGTIKRVVSCNIADMVPLSKRAVLSVMKRKELVSSVSGDGRVVDFRDLADNDGVPAPVAVHPDATALLQFTGGTTGHSKGVMLSHFNIAANFAQIADHLTTRAESGFALRPGQERFLAAAPYSHIMGLTFSMITAIGLGAEQLIVADPRDTAALTRAVLNKRVSVFPTVPYRLRLMTEELRRGRRYRNGLPDLRLVVAGGSALLPDVKEDFERAAGRQGIVTQAYGMTEASPAIASMPCGADRQKAGSVGLPLAGTDIRICAIGDPQMVLGPMQSGEICVRGPQVMKGYMDDPQAVGTIVDGWLRTGDAGYRDEDGYLFLVDRLKDTINIMGKNVFPGDVEREIMAHEAVAECAVIGVPDEKTEEAAKAFIRFKPGAVAPDERELREFLAARLGKIKVPKHFAFQTTELPKTPLGKPDKKALRALEHAGGQQSAAPALRGPV